MIGEGEDEAVDSGAFYIIDKKGFIRNISSETDLPKGKIVEEILNLVKTF